jgi:P27 family predicted phage terminase small subunit
MPLSTDPAKRATQLANLQPGAGQASDGNGRALTHGGYSAALVADVETEVLELMEALGGSAPVHDPDGSLPAADVAAVERAARALKRWRTLSQWCDLHGRIVERGKAKGAVKPAAELELKAERELAAALEALGMTPRSRAALGVDLVRARVTAEEAEAARAARERLDARAGAVEATTSEGDR